ncbi:hypothetical protein DVB69_06495 [Sporosarcina sp. BI001-red]|uniref:competence protein ComK n=1 Tax=Sporosarcina sp. BI001-red TaxID=2282866 RepID=UPI000E25D018|nr:competence protein ComK [Sporosarcina sp. BI001-red]REB08768.1 hypothetical protein DVB69_06495 [Sporosarcina sp. BI001-red]
MTHFFLDWKCADFIWITVGHVVNYVKTENNIVPVTFNNGSQVCLPISYYQFNTLQYRIETNNWDIFINVWKFKQLEVIS